MSCPFRKHDNPAGARFCNDCGANLAAPTIAREPRSYTPRHLVEKILASQSALRGERKLVTVLFADVVRSMELAERVDPEEYGRLISRNGRDHTRRFPEIAGAVAKPSPRDLVLEAEVAIYDQQLRSRFDWLREPDPDALATPPVLMAFDVLHQDGRELTGRPLHERRTRLEKVLAGREFVLPIRRLARNGFEAWAEVIARDFEGLVAKDETSLYEAGPTRRWLKVKQKDWTVEEDRWQRRISARA